MPLGTARLVCLPIDDKGLEVIALARQPLPAIGAKGWSKHIDLMLGLGGDQEIGIHIATIEQVGLGEQITSGPKSCWMVGPMTLSGRVAGVVITCVMRSGWSTSQVQ
jgi:hypothetical protein